MKRLFLLCSSLALAGASVISSAGPLQRTDLPANATWLLHIDWDALRSTAIGQFLQGELDKPEAQAKLAAFQAIVSIDLRTQLHGTTLYGTGSEDAVMLLYADFNSERLVTLAKAAKEAENSAYKSHTIYSWIDEKKHHKSKPSGDGRIYAAIDGRRVVFGHRQEAVARALDVLDGAVPNLAATHDFPEFGVPGDASFIEAAANKMVLPQSDANAAILRLSRQVKLQIAQAQQEVSATLTLQASSDEVAGNIATVAQGLIALMKLQDKPETAHLVQALSLKQNGAEVMVSATLPAKDVVEMIQADAARKAAAKAHKAQAERQ